MGCNCKNDKNNLKETLNSSKEDKSLFIKGINLTVKTFLYIITGSIATVIVIPFTLYMLFKVVFFEEGIDVSGSLLYLGKILKRKDKDEEDEDEYEFEDEDELELMDVME